MKKIVKFISLIMSFVYIVICCSSCACLYSDEYIYLKEYFSVAYPKSNNVVYVTDGNTTTYYMEKILFSSSEKGAPIYISKDKIFTLEFSNGINKVYEYDFNGNNKKDIFEYKSKNSKLYMHDENNIYIEDLEKNRYFIKNIENQNVLEITKEEFNESFYKNNYYSVKEIDKDDWIEGYEIKNENTDEIKTVLKEQFKNVEIVKKLSEYDEFYFVDFTLKNDNIFFLCSSYSFHLVFEYNFETEEILLVDWSPFDLKIFETMKIFILE